MKLKFISSCDQKLNNSASLVPLDEILSQQNQFFIKDFLAFCGYEATPTSKPKLTRMVGCAAPQVGVMKQIVIVDTAIHPEKRNFHQMNFHVLINPKIIWSAQETAYYPESCYSVPMSYTGVIQRPTAVVVEAFDQNKNKIRRRYEGYTARVVQHEIDHLVGIRFPQRATTNNEIHKINFSRREDLLNYRSHYKTWKDFASPSETLLLQKGHYANLQ